MTFLFTTNCDYWIIQDAGPICQLSLERVPLIKMQRYMMQIFFAYYAGWIEAKLTRHQMGLLKEVMCVEIICFFLVSYIWFDEEP